MIKKSPKFTGTVDVNDPLEENDYQAEPHSGAEFEPSPEPADEFDHLHEYHENTLDYDAATDNIQQRKKSMLITYIASGLGFLLLVFIGYNQFSTMFSHSTSTVSAVSTFPRKTNNMAGLAPPKDTMVAPAPAAAITTPPPAVEPPAQAVTTVEPLSNPPASVQMAPAQQPSANLPPILPTPPSVPAPPVSSTSNLPTPPALPSSNADAKFADLSNQVNSLQTSVATLLAQKSDTTDQLQKLQNSLDTLQNKVTQLSEEKSTSSHIAKIKSAATPLENHSSHHTYNKGEKGSEAKHLQSAQGGGWILRAATPDMALIGRPGTNDLQRVSIGDNVSGLGKIKSINDLNGHWVVEGTSGSIGQ